MFQRPRFFSLDAAATVLFFDDLATILQCVYLRKAAQAAKKGSHRYLEKTHHRQSAKDSDSWSHLKRLHNDRGRGTRSLGRTPLSTSASRLPEALSFMALDRIASLVPDVLSPRDVACLRGIHRQN